MVTNYPHSIAQDDQAAVAVHAEDGVGARVLDKVRQVFCGLHGHDNLLQFERDRMFLRCASCGRETPGWELNDAPPDVAVRKEVRPAMVRTRFASARRIA